MLKPVRILSRYQALRDSISQPEPFSFRVPRTWVGISTAKLGSTDDNTIVISHICEALTINLLAQYRDSHYDPDEPASYGVQVRGRCPR